MFTLDVGQSIRSRTGSQTLAALEDVSDSDPQMAKSSIRRAIDYMKEGSKQQEADSERIDANCRIQCVRCQIQTNRPPQGLNLSHVH